ncbi:MAG: AraC family transcriptional regulator [Moraxellaceae bacterium]|nr:AraC family transcriptional regulator [Moraxellaceae bacterium]MDZ4386179.1 AraC family transcriptional regulator [Moraxellaceae bacterium]
MNPHHHTVSGHVIRAILTRAEQQQADVDRLIAEAGLNQTAIWAPETRVLPVQFASLMQALWRQRGDEFMGFTELPMRVGSFPLMMHSVLTANTLGDALRYGCHFYHVLTDEVRLNLHTDASGQQAMLRLSLKRPELDTDHVLTETILLSWYRFASWLINRRILLSATAFSYPAPLHVAEYHQLYPCPHQFDAEHTQLVFSAEVLNQPLMRSREELKALIKTLPLGFFVKPVYQGSWGHRVRSRLLQVDFAEFPSLAELARELHLSERTLRRKLENEDSSYQLIKDELRRDRAISLLRQRELDINVISHAVGYREASVFIKAFRLWTGMTPGDYRSRSATKRAMAAIASSASGNKSPSN